MLQATFKISGAELSAELLDKIKNLFIGESGDFEVVITVRPKESLEEQKLRIDRSIENIENKENIVPFSPEEYETLVSQLSRQ